MLPHDQEEEIIALCQSLGTFVSGHFELPSGHHSDLYINKELIFDNSEIFDMFCSLLAQQLLDPYEKGKEPQLFRDTSFDVIAGPATGGSRIAEKVASKLREFTDREIISITVHKDGLGGFSLDPEDIRRIAGRNIAMTEDVLTTGASVRKARSACQAAGGNATAVAAWFRRGLRSLSSRSFVICHKEFPLFVPGNGCYLCQSNVPLTPHSARLNREIDEQPVLA